MKVYPEDHGTCMSTLQLPHIIVAITEVGWILFASDCIALQDCKFDIVH